MDCDKGMYYDRGTNSCAYCSQLCSYVDIQGTRAECEGNCPGFLQSTTQSTTQSVVTATTSVLQDNPWYIVAIVLSCLVAFVALGVIIYMYIIPAAVRRLKKQDCCGDGESRQPHTQETGSPEVRTEAMDLLGNNNGQQP
ncbi:uncharacterized protein LOC124152009 isoform X2 [Haliotis rufescens]|uniref:uncharacterized protein LOC124152009 isoform X2 n=1 Tax=Haliotis rufescens TaxID=6454 RepID=UPI00201FA8BF|nr:uncharacterized protein LOC124152009 isoform X2 [Haliotis rufescens]